MTFPELAVRAFGPGRVRAGEPLASCTSFRIGGAADWLVDVHTAGELQAALALAREAGAGVTVLGGGTNVLVADEGIRGVVIRVRGGAVRPLADGRVQAEAGVSLSSLVRWTATRGLAGLESFAGTPGTVGGAIHGNAHSGERWIGDLVEAVSVVEPDGTVTDIPRPELAFSYDHSRLKTSREVLLRAVLVLVPGRDAGALRATARRALAHRRRTQPLRVPSAGCVFRNPDPARDRVPAGLPASAGALIDRAGLKGRSLGGARVSTVHGNFIVNDGDATAADVRSLIEVCRQTVFERFGVRLREEIEYLGEFGEPTRPGAEAAIAGSS